MSGIDNRLAESISAYSVSSEDHSLIQASTTFTITTKDDDRIASEYRHLLKAFIERVEGHYKTITTALNGFASLVRGMRDADLHDPQEALKALDEKLLAYRVQAEAEQKARQLAADKAALAVAVAERAARADALKATAAAEADEFTRQAIEAEAASVAVAPVVPVTIEVESSAATDTGVSVAYRWSAEVYDLNELVQAVARGDVDLDAINPNKVWLNKQAVARHERLGIPGVRPVKKPGLRGKNGKK